MRKVRALGMILQRHAYSMDKPDGQTIRRYEMNTMTIPGFTAESSLGHISKPYRSAGGGADSANGGLVIPQRIKLREWTCECDAATDICVCTSGGAMRVIHAVLGEL